MDKYKIIITGCENSGTTFLFRLFILLNFDCGFPIDRIEKYTSKDLNSNPTNCKFQISKNLVYAHKINEIVKETKIDHIICPIREIEECLSLSNTETYHQYTLSKLITDCITADINLILINFYKMISDPKLLYYKLYSIVKDIEYSNFLSAYGIATSLSVSSPRISSFVKIDKVDKGKERDNGDYKSKEQLPSYEEIFPPNSPLSSSPIETLNNNSGTKIKIKTKTKRTKIIYRNGEKIVMSL